MPEEFIDGKLEWMPEEFIDGKLEWMPEEFIDGKLEWMPEEFIDGKSTLVQVMAWCRQAASHYLNQCWPRPLLPFNVNWGQCNELI